MSNGNEYYDKNAEESLRKGIINIDASRATPSMISSLQKMHKHLSCSICHNLMTDPTTLSCTHSFCLYCISNHKHKDRAKEWICPKPGCCMPISVRGKKSYPINPQLASLVDSLHKIHRTLRCAQPHWWKCQSGLFSASQESVASSAGNCKEQSLKIHPVNEMSEENEDKGVNLMEMESSQGFEAADLKNLSPNNNACKRRRKEGKKDNNDDDSDATTLGNDNDSLSTDINTPVLKRRRRECNSEYLVKKVLQTITTSTSTYPDSKTDMPVGSKLLESNSASARTATKANTKPGMVPTNTAPINSNANNNIYSPSADEESIATQVFINNQNTHAYGGGSSQNHDGEHPSFFSDNQTPQEINFYDHHSHSNNKDKKRISCAIPDESFRLSPIAMEIGGSETEYGQLLQDRRQGKVQNMNQEERGFLKDISEEMDVSVSISGMDATTEEMSPMPVPVQFVPPTGNKKQCGDDVEVEIDAKVDDEDKRIHVIQNTKTGKNRTISVQKKNGGSGSAPLKELKLSESNRDQRNIQIDTFDAGPKPIDGLSTATSKSPLKKQSTSVASKLDPALIDSCDRPPIPLVFLISPSQTLISADQRIIQKFSKHKRLQILQPERITETVGSCNLDFPFNFDLEKDVASFLWSLYTVDKNSHFPVEYSYAICSNAEYQTFDGFMMPRSFRFILAVACGLSIIDLSYLRKATSASFGIHDSRKYLYAPGTVKINDNSRVSGRSGNRRKRSCESDEKKEENYQIAGDVESMDLMGPQRSREALLKKLKLLKCSDEYSNGLLDAYEILLFGDFDELPTAMNETSSQKKRRGRAKIGKSNAANDTPDNIYSKGRVNLLLKLCGATVIDVCHDTKARGTISLDPEKNTIILTRHEADKRLKKKMKATLTANTVSDERIREIPCVDCKWLQDSIAEFRVKGICND